VVVARSVLRGLGLPRWGNLRRVEPFSRRFGFERGTPIDRYYLHTFLAAHAAAITGDVLEIQQPDYTRRFGRALVATDSVDVNPAFSPTYLCDLAQAERIIPSDRYDCFLLPNTLCVLRDIEGCLRQALRVVRPGGVILATTATLGPLAPDVPDYWRLSVDGWREILTRTWPGCGVLIEAHGNCLAATAAMLGLAAEELTPAELDVLDPLYPVLVTIRCDKPLR
jgi:SAM-dependent methyltransferase